MITLRANVLFELMQCKLFEYNEIASCGLPYNLTLDYTVMLLVVMPYFNHMQLSLQFGSVIIIEPGSIIIS